MWIRINSILGVSVDSDHLGSFVGVGTAGKEKKQLGLVETEDK